MSFRNPLGSDTAMSLAANPLALPVVMTMAGVAVTISAAVWSYHTFSEFMDKRRRKQIRRVNKLHEEHLKKIFIADFNEIQGFPPIFKLGDKDKASQVDMMHFTDEQIKAFGTTTPRSSDVLLNKYRECILKAILKLKEYYLNRTERDDVTAGVLSYLLHILDTKCLHFAGYEYDLAYLHALIKFINAYASIEGTINSQHFTRLTPVIRYLREAQQELDFHKRTLSLTEMVTDVSSFCISTSKRMIHSFAQLISQEKKWKYIPTATHDEMFEGLLRRRYVHTQVLGVKLSSDAEIKIPKSNFADWLNFMLRYFEESIDPDSPMTIADIKSPSDAFYIPDLEHIADLKKKSIWSIRRRERQEIEKANNTLKQMRKIFAKCENFVTMKLDPDRRLATPRFMHISDDEELVERSRTVAAYATLIHQMLSLQYMSVYLSKCIRQLGEINVKNPKHFALIFNVVEGLCVQIKQSTYTVKEAIVGIQRSNQNVMKLEAQELFPEEIMEMMDTVHTSIGRLATRIKHYRDNAGKTAEALSTEAESVKNEMFAVAARLATIYDIDRDNAALLSELSDDARLRGAGTRRAHTFLTRTRRIKTFWDKNKLKILAGLAITLGVICMVGAAVMSALSFGALSPVGVLMAGLGVKVAITGAALAATDAAVGFAIGMLGGGLIDGAVLIADAKHKRISSHAKINQAITTSHEAPVKDKPKPVIAASPMVRSKPAVVVPVSSRRVPPAFTAKRKIVAPTSDYRRRVV